MKNPFDLTGKVALVTGSGRGLGAAMAEALGAAGSDLVLTDIREPAETAAKALSLGVKVKTVAADLSGMDGVREVAERAIGAFSRVDILVNNAGIIRRTPATDFSEKDWDDVMALNAKSVFFLSQALARDMMKRKKGKIINVASLLSFQGGITVPSYAASKAAVAQLTRALANEWAGSGINVNAIAPGYMVTDNTAELRKDPARFRAISERIPAGRWGLPEDLGGAVVFLASEASEYVHGHVLVVDGGWLAR